MVVRATPESHPDYVVALVPEVGLGIDEEMRVVPRVACRQCAVSEWKN